MPTEHVLVYECETGKPAFMHSVDAAEAVRMGDYTYAQPKEAPAPEEMALARARAQGVSAPGHPELMTPEERERVRAEANEVTMPSVAVPMGQPVVLREGHAEARSAREAQNTSRSARSQGGGSEDKK